MESPQVTDNTSSEHLPTFFVAGLSFGVDVLNVQKGLRLPANDRRTSGPGGQRETRQGPLFQGPMFWGPMFWRYP